MKVIGAYKGSSYPTISIFGEIHHTLMPESDGKSTDLYASVCCRILRLFRTREMLDGGDSHTVIAHIISTSN